jgi:outer membrane usher protein
MARSLTMAVLLSLSITTWGQTRPDVPAAAGSADRLFPLDATVNGQGVGTWPFIERAGVLYASSEAMEEWRVRLQPGAPSITVRGMKYWPLTAIPGYTAKPNYANQSIELTFSPDAFTDTRITQEKTQRPQLSPVLPSAFFNYELNYTYTHTSRLNRRDLGALTEIGASNEWGVLTSSAVGRNLVGGTSDAERAHWTRLETTFTHDFPEDNHTLRIGDTSTRVGLWGRNVYYAGIQYGTNYSLTPGYLTNPVPVVRGVSSAQSTVELYVNGALRQVSQVPAGPFAIDNAALLTGGGEACVVVRDILGREVVITQPFFTSSSLLAQGLTDWGVDAGTLRYGLGSESSHYGAGFVAGTWRYGVSDTLTTEARAEVTGKMQAAGLGLVAVLPGNVLGRAAWALSESERVGFGQQWTVGFEKHWLNTSIYTQAQGASASFRSLGLSSDLLAARGQWVVNLTHTTQDWGSFGLAVAGLRAWNQASSTTASANYSLRVGLNSTLSVNVGRVFGTGAGTTAGVMLQVPLDHGRQVTTNVQHHGGQWDAYATASQTAGLDSDFGWRVLGGWLSDEPHGEAGVSYRGRFGNLYGEVSGSSGQSGLRAGATGGLVFADGHLFATRRVEQSLALVEVKDVDGIGVGLGSTMLTKTDEQGLALLPNLGAYSPNQIRLNPQDLPISTDIDTIEKIVVPRLRSAVKIEFPVRAGRAALVRVLLDDGEPAPPGATVRVAGNAEEFLVARRGEVYVSGLQPRSDLELQWNGQRCAFPIALPPLKRDDIARATVACKGVKR